MRKLALLLSIIGITFLAACGGSSHGTTTTADEVPVVLTVQDPTTTTGPTALSYTIQITGVSLQSSTNSSTNVSLLSSPVTVNLSNLQTINTLLANTTAAAGTYSSMTITFASPSVTLLNSSGGNFTDGTTTCPSTSTSTTPCTLAPALTTSTVTISTSPFPLTLTAGTPVQLAIDFNSSSSLVDSSGTFTIQPNVTVATNATNNGTTGDLVDFTNMTGQVTSASNNNVVVTDLSTGNSLTLASGTNTTFTGFNTSATCATANTFGCVQPGQIVNFGFGINGSSASTPTLSSVNLNAGVTNGVSGTVIGPMNNGMVPILVTSESPAFQGTNTSIVGQVVDVTPSGTATFSAQLNGATAPAGVSFASSADFVPGQSVMFDSTGFTAGTSGAPGMLATDNVILVPSQFSGTVDTLNSTNNSLMLNGLDGVLADNGISTVSVNTGTSTTFGGVSGFSGLAAGNTVEIGGLLFNTTGVPGSPTLVAGQVNVPVTTTTTVAAKH